jgi:hypothetical protein
MDNRLILEALLFIHLGIPRLVATPSAQARGGLREVAIRVLRPSCDLGQLAAAYEPRMSERTQMPNVS